MVFRGLRLPSGTELPLRVREQNFPSQFSIRAMKKMRLRLAFLRLNMNPLMPWSRAAVSVTVPRGGGYWTTFSLPTF
jgi:hypothetical protein